MALTVPGGRRPEVELRIGGRPVEPRLAHDVVEVDVSEEVGRHGRCTLLLQNWDVDRRAVRWSDDEQLSPGAQVEVLLGYDSELSRVFDGVVTALTAHFPAGHGPTLQVEARSRSVLLAGPVVSRTFEDAADGDVLTALASEAGLDADVEDGAAHEAVVLRRRTPWSWAVERAEALGWVTYVRDRTLVARPPAGPADPVELTWTKNLVELRLTQDVTTLPGRSAAAGWDTDAQEQQEASASDDAGGLDVGDRDDHATAVAATGWAGRDEVLATCLPPDRLEARATARARWAELRHVTGTGRTVGLPALRCDGWVTVGGVGDRFAGPFYLSSVRHRLGRRGFTTEFGLGLAAPLLPVAVERTAAGGLLAGVVTDVEDPQEQARVKVAFPWSGDADAVWARLATSAAGDGHGLLAVPDVGQEVLVGFLDGSADHPVVLGSLWSGAAAPPVQPDAANAVRVLVTPGGHRVELDDSDDGGLTLRTSAGHEVALADGDGSLTLLAKGGNKVVLSDDGIELSAGQGDLTLSAPTGEVRINGLSLTAKADAGASVESSTTLDIKAAATLGLKGALVNIN